MRTKKNNEGIYRGDTTMNLRNLSPSNFSIPTKSLGFIMLNDQAETRQIPGPEAMAPFLKITQLMKTRRYWTHIRVYRLRIKHFESTRNYQSNGTPADPQNHIRFKIERESNEPQRPKLTLNYAVNRMTNKCNNLFLLHRFPRANEHHSEAQHARVVKA